MKKPVYVVMFVLILSISTSIMAKPTVEAKGAILIETKTNTILYEKNAYSKFYPASITKLLTALLIQEQLPDNTVITKSQNSVRTVPPDSSHIGLNIGDRYNKTNGLYGLLLGSDNFIAHDLAITNSGTISQFAELMNTRAKELGAKNTHFTNPHGYHDPNHYTTPYDMALIAKAAFANPTVQKIAGTAQFNFYVSNKNKTIPIKNTSRLVKSETPYYNSAVVASKTGYHSDAGQTLVAKAVYGDMELIAVVMSDKTPNQYIDVNNLFNYAKTNYSVEASNGTYILKNRTISTWASSSITKAINNNWIDKTIDFNEALHTEDLVALLKKVGLTYNGVTMQEVYDLTQLEKGDLVKREQFAEIIMLAINKWGLSSEITSTKTIPNDISNLPYNTQNAITYMASHNLMTLTDDCFRPSDTITFAEALCILDRLLPEVTPELTVAE